MHVLGIVWRIWDVCFGRTSNISVFLHLEYILVYGNELLRNARSQHAEECLSKAAMTQLHESLRIVRKVRP
jgi:hypothetical protein